MTDVSTDSGAQLLSIVQRVERLHAERDSISDDVRDVYAEAKGNGFDVKTIKEIVKRRAQDPDELAEAEALLEVYNTAIERAEQAPATRARAKTDTDNKNIAATSP